LKSRVGAKNLHAVWDSVAYAFSEDMDRPLSAANWDKLST